MKLNIILIVVLVFSTLFVTSQAYAPCIEGPGINCNNYPPQALTQIKSDKINYETSDKPVITISGVPSTVAHLEIDDSSSNIIFTHDINLSSNGTARYVLDISYYKPDVYSATATSLVSKVTTGFSVGLAPTGGRIVINSDRNSYLPGDNVAIVGTWTSNTLIQLSLIDPSGISVKSSQTFSDKTGHFSSSDLVIPMDAISGIWQIGADSGMTHARAQISINSTVDNHSKIKLDEAVVLSPLKQFKSGVAANDIICRPDMQLLIQNHENLPICVKLNSVSNLLRHDWSYPSNCKYEQDGFTAGVGGIIVIEKNASDSFSDKSYSPRNSTIVIGWNNTVSWINQDVTPSSVTSDWNLFDSGPILPGNDWHHDFECAGNYGYHSEPHPWMRGWIRVLPPSR